MSANIPTPTKSSRATYQPPPALATLNPTTINRGYPHGPGTYILEDGDYSEPITIPGGTHLASRTLYGARLLAPLTITGMHAALTGATLEAAPGEVCISAEHDAAELELADLVMHGHGVGTAGLMAYGVSGLITRRIACHGFTRYGLFLANHGGPNLKTVPRAFQAWLREDTIWSSIGNGGDSNGTAEFGVWCGLPTIGRRSLGRGGDWGGMWHGGASTDSLEEDWRVSGTPVALYLEHDTRRLAIGDGIAWPTSVGINCEWDGGKAGNGAAHDCRITGNVTIHGCLVHIYADQGTDHLHVDGGHLNLRAGARQRAGIADYHTIACTYGAPTWTTDLPPGTTPEPWPISVPRITHGHPSTSLALLSSEQDELARYTRKRVHNAGPGH